MDNETEMTDAEVMELLVSNTPLNRARKVFRASYARLEQAGLSVMDVRRAEFEAVKKIAAELGVSL